MLVARINMNTRFYAKCIPQLQKELAPTIPNAFRNANPPPTAYKSKKSSSHYPLRSTPCHINKLHHQFITMAIVDLNPSPKDEEGYGFPNPNGVVPD
jgi:hypothetical protein